MNSTDAPVRAGLYLARGSMAAARVRAACDAELHREGSHDRADSAAYYTGVWARSLETFTAESVAHAVDTSIAHGYDVLVDAALCALERADAGSMAAGDCVITPAAMGRWLSTACLTSHTSLARRLIDAGASLDAPRITSEDFVATPLQIAAAYGDAATFAQLLDAGACARVYSPAYGGVNQLALVFSALTTPAALERVAREDAKAIVRTWRAHVRAQTPTLIVDYGDALDAPEHAGVRETILAARQSSIHGGRGQADDERARTHIPTYKRLMRREFAARFVTSAEYIGRLSIVFIDDAASHDLTGVLYEDTIYTCGTDITDCDSPKCRLHRVPTPEDAAARMDVTLRLFQLLVLEGDADPLVSRTVVRQGARRLCAPVQLAAMYGRGDMLRFVLRECAEDIAQPPTRARVSGDALIDMVLVYGHVDCVQALLDVEDLSFAYSMQDGIGALDAAVQPHLASVFPRIFSRVRRDARTAARVAREDEAAALRRVVNQVATYSDPDCTCRVGVHHHAPLERAVMWGMERAARLLMRYGADVMWACPCGCGAGVISAIGMSRSMPVAFRKWLSREFREAVGRRRRAEAAHHRPPPPPPLAPSPTKSTAPHSPPSVAKPRKAPRRAMRQTAHPPPRPPKPATAPDALACAETPGDTSSDDASDDGVLGSLVGNMFAALAPRGAARPRPRAKTPPPAPRCRVAADEDPQRPFQPASRSRRRRRGRRGGRRALRVEIPERDARASPPPATTPPAETPPPETPRSVVENTPPRAARPVTPPRAGSAKSLKLQAPKSALSPSSAPFPSPLESKIQARLRALVEPFMHVRGSLFAVPVHAGLGAAYPRSA